MTVCIIDPITFFLEASSFTFTQFGIIYTISGMPSHALTFGYLARMLPLVDCKNYQVYSMRFYAVGVMLGSIFAGILSYYMSYPSTRQNTDERLAPAVTFCQTYRWP